jgi:hypothetical protein
VLATSTTAAKEEMLSSFAQWCAQTRISTNECEGEKPHQGVSAQKSASFLGQELSKSRTALGLALWAGKTVSGPAVAANNGTNCAPLTPGCSNVPTALQVKQFVQQQCLGQFNNSSLGGAVNFMSMASPVIGPNPLGSTIEDVGGTTLKYGVYQFFNSASQSMAGTPFGSMSGIVAEGIETIAKDVVLPVAVGATGLQVIAHAGCATVGGQAAGQMNPLPPGIQF